MLSTICKAEIWKHITTCHPKTISSFRSNTLLRQEFSARRHHFQFVHLHQLQSEKSEQKRQKKSKVQKKAETQTGGATSEERIRKHEKTGKKKLAYKTPKDGAIVKLSRESYTMDSGERKMWKDMTDEEKLKVKRGKNTAINLLLVAVFVLSVVASFYIYQARRNRLREAALRKRVQELEEELRWIG